MKTIYCFMSGVYKLDYMSAGAPQLRELAQQRIEKDPHFVSLIIRKVSKENHGIHFVYINPELEVEKDLESHQLRFDKEIRESFIGGIYAYDVWSTDSQKQAEFAIVK